ncbi:hypothetical protein BJ508DRAFT_306568 [Ascobolus immersus RN42]|uniref:Uncharacterized protein n=1 Tax=Ascobolus immersus RN42 TaxID=1160509 RepID=A0A3N4I748_ASCIM|nr:hypothetical protein BJ508DRAFT_306568 [Ascobolus immersus RN42]
MNHDDQPLREFFLNSSPKVEETIQQIRDYLTRSANFIDDIDPDLHAFEILMAEDGLNSQASREFGSLMGSDQILSQQRYKAPLDYLMLFNYTAFDVVLGITPLIWRRYASFKRKVLYCQLGKIKTLYSSAGIGKSEAAIELMGNINGSGWQGWWYSTRMASSCFTNYSEAIPWWFQINELARIDNKMYALLAQYSSAILCDKPTKPTESHFQRGIRNSRVGFNSHTRGDPSIFVRRMKCGLVGETQIQLLLYLTVFMMERTKEWVLVQLDWIETGRRAPVSTKEHCAGIRTDPAFEISAGDGLKAPIDYLETFTQRVPTQLDYDKTHPRSRHYADFNRKLQLCEIIFATVRYILHSFFLGQTTKFTDDSNLPEELTGFRLTRIGSHPNVDLELPIGLDISFRDGWQLIGATGDSMIYLDIHIAQWEYRAINDLSILEYGLVWVFGFFYQNMVLWERRESVLAARMKVGLVSEVHVELLQAALRFNMRMVMDWVLEQLDVIGSGGSLRAESIVDVEKLRRRVPVNRGLLRFLVNLRSESIEARIWKYLHEE